MVVLIVGSTGFLGRRLAWALIREGHHVWCAARGVSPEIAMPCARTFAIDLARDTRVEDWMPRVEGVDVVINAAGIFRESRGQSFHDVHERAPCALFEAAARAGVARVVQISALGAAPDAPTAFLRSKARADEFLAALPLDWVVVRPSLIHGEGGRSAQLFASLASRAWIPLPGNGRQEVQPVHVDDVIAGLVALVKAPGPLRVTVPFVGPEALTLREHLGRLRAAMGLGKARFLPIPMVLVRAAAALGRFSRRALLDPDALRMLMAGNTADPRPLEQLLGRPARPVESFASRSSTPAAPSLDRLLLILRLAIAVAWLVAGVVSLLPVNQDESYARLARVGASGAFATTLLYGAALLDLAFGVASLCLPRRALWLAQIAIVLLYTALLTVYLPELWLEPFGPVVKNLPFLAGLWILYRTERA